ncbi:MAG: hypothetical protein SFZ24_08760 [Planctomycetota bacterium]|nr:hypothetical protein [Planctomycetota bacterium]
MDARRFEDDLADLIEGRLDPDRAPRVREALGADAALAARVAAMVEDRRALAASGSAEPLDRGLVRAALAQAEHEALHGETPREQRARRRGRGRSLAVAGSLAAVLVAAAGGAIGLLALGREARNEAPDRPRPVVQMDTIPEEELAAAVQPTRPAELELASGFSRQAASAAGIAGETVEQLAAGAADLMGPPEPEVIAEAEAVPAWMSLGSEEGSRDLIDAWSSEATELNDSASAEAAERLRLAGEAALERVRGGGPAELTLDEAAALALTHRLVIVGGRSAGAVASAGARSGAISGPGESVLVVAGVDAARAELRDELERVLRGFSGASGTGPARLRLAGTEADASGVLPATALDDVLWWSGGRPVDGPGRVSIRVEILSSE